MGLRLTLLIPHVFASNNTNPSPLEIEDGYNAAKASIAAFGGMGIQTQIELDDNFDGIYEDILAEATRPAPWPILRFDEEQGVYRGYTEGLWRDWGPLMTAESHRLAIVLSSPKAADTWRNRAARAYLGAMPPGVPVVIWPH